MSNLNDRFIKVGRSLQRYVAPSVLIVVLFSLFNLPGNTLSSMHFGNKALAEGDSGSGEGVINKMLAPGPLIEGHKNLEHGDCLKCHDAGKGVPDNKCLSCHTAINKSVQSKDSFHALTNKPCISCHSDHKGRLFDSTKVDTNKFHHAVTGFKLNGAHAKVKCASCHSQKRSSKPVRKEGIRFFGTDDSCKSCHKKDDPHAFPPKFAAMECSACHNENSWKKADFFDHKKETGYALIGDHAKLKCAECHAPKDKPAKYKFPELSSSKCLTCHVDQHKTNLSPEFRGGACDRCHTQTTWKIDNFNHAITGFVLKGAHAKEACVSCHVQGSGVSPYNQKAFKWVGLATNCSSCHKDYHGFGQESAPKFGALLQCQECHNETAWKAGVNFEHNRDTRYPIDGKHVGVKCFDCHKPLGSPRVSKASRNLRDALRDYAFPELEKKTCETCHKSPHPSTGTDIFTKNKCSTCHTTEGWKVLGKGGGSFNHDKQTRFALTGDHATLKCDTCHLKGRKQVYKFPGSDKQFCESCHKSVHKDQFSPKFQQESCATCHNTSDFKNLTGFNHNLSRFLLTGDHKKIESKCFDCHKATTKTLPTKPRKVAHKFIFEHQAGGFCVDCHKNPHKQQFSERFPADSCQDCHNTTSFADLLLFDHDKTRFKIVGDHIKFKSKCSECHVKTDKFLDTKPPKPAGKYTFDHAKEGFCESCHKNVHTEQFSPKFLAMTCTECHTQSSFTKRLPFNHKKTDFDLTGAHLKIKGDCAECHVKTSKMLAITPPKPASKFQFDHAKTGYCEACHLSEHKDQFHPKFASKPCQDCHITASFDGKNNFQHKQARFDVKNKHLEVKCAECHVKTSAKFRAAPRHAKGKYIFPDLVSKNCATCHKDPHGGKFGKQCSECHSDEGWEKTAEYHKNFMLGGVHNLVECVACHQDSRRLSGMGRDCKLCHEKDDPHQGTQPDCQSCHNQMFWQTSTFKHSFTDFPLRGVHRTLECSECHNAGIYEGLVSECSACHFQDAEKVATPNHKVGGFENCEQCHNQFSFSKKGG